MSHPDLVQQFGEGRTAIGLGGTSPARGRDEVGGQGFFADTAEAAERPVKPRI